VIPAYVLLALSVWVADGTLPGLPLVVAALWFLVKAWRQPIAPSRRTLAIALAICLLAALIRKPAIYLDASRWPFFAASLALGAVLLAGVVVPRASIRAALAAALTISALQGVAVIVRSPSPKIDVFVIEREGARALLAGKNPYSASYKNPYDPDETRAFFGDERTTLDAYPYPPLSLYATTASQALGGDPRWVLLAAQLAAALILWLIALRTGHPPWLALGVAGLWLLHPRGLFVLEQAWSESLLACALVCLTYALVCENAVAIALALGASLALKQYAVLLVPLVRARIRPILAAFVLAAAVTLPLLWRDPRAFLDDVILFQLRQPFRMDALSFPALVAWATGWHSPAFLAPVAAAGVIAATWRKSRFALASALTLCALFLCAKQAFCNYYWLASALVLAGGATIAPDGR
jgi:hypothetical protein